MRARFYRVAVAVLLIGVTGLGACNKDDDGGTGPLPATVNVTGTWTINETVNATQCDEGIYSDSYTIAVTQSGSSLTVVADTGTFSGTISGSTISWTGSYPETGGTTTITSMSLSVGPTGDSLSGNVSWSWTDGQFTCSGTTQLQGTKTS